VKVEIWSRLWLPSGLGILDSRFDAQRRSVAVLLRPRLPGHAAIRLRGACGSDRSRGLPLRRGGSATDAHSGFARCADKDRNRASMRSREPGYLEDLARNGERDAGGVNLRLERLDRNRRALVGSQGVTPVEHRLRRSPSRSDAKRPNEISDQSSASPPAFA
jgi:hypothetical protein